MVRVTRRYHVIDRISRRLGSLSGGHTEPDAINGHGANINSHGSNVNGHGSNVNGHRASANVHGANVNGVTAPAVVTNGHGHSQRPEPRVPPPHGEPTVFLRAELNGHRQQPPPATRLGRYSRYINGEGRGGSTRNGLEKQILLQQAEICSLRNGERELGLKTNAIIILITTHYKPLRLLEVGLKDYRSIFEM